MKKLIVFMFSIVLLGSCQKDIEGCTDATAVNYNPDATIDNSTCQYVPSLSTMPISITNNNNGTTAETGGIISSDGGQAVTLRGVCWSTSPNPTIADDTTINGSGTGTFSSTITGLSNPTTYYVRAYATNSNGTGYGDELILATPLFIGMSYQGGIIFYLDGNGGGLVAAPTDQNVFGDPWGCSGTNIPGADDEAIGAGYQNTIDIEAGCTTAGTPADMCANLTLGGYSDWFLPSKDELNEMYLNKTYVGGFEIGGPTNFALYWSSTEIDSDHAWAHSFYDGSQYNLIKNGYEKVRPVRAF